MQVATRLFAPGAKGKQSVREFLRFVVEVLWTVMSFFDLPEQNLEEERRKYLEGGGKDGDQDLQVFTWGEDSYDGLGDALQEGGDELNDETFGGIGVVGEGLSTLSCRLS